jgi:hypothetical protein
MSAQVLQLLLKNQQIIVKIKKFHEDIAYKFFIIQAVTYDSPNFFNSYELDIVFTK